MNEHWGNILVKHQLQGERLYQQAMNDGICAEQARLFLSSYGMYVKFYWTASVQGIAHLISQRTKPDAQKEFQEYAKAIELLALQHFPISIKELLNRDTN